MFSLTTFVVSFVRCRHVYDPLLTTHRRHNTGTQWSFFQTCFTSMVSQTCRTMRLESLGQVVDLNGDVIVVTYERDVMIVPVVKATSDFMDPRVRISHVVV